MKITEAFAVLKEHFGTHRAAASALGVSERQYIGWRVGTYPVPESRKRHIIVLAGSLLGDGDIRGGRS